VIGGAGRCGGSASATLEGIEVANMIRKGQMTPGLCPFAQFASLAA
jgi:putative transposase